MKMTVTALVASLGLMSAACFANTPKPADPPSQQSRMKTCNADAKAKSLKGDERKAFMSQCLKSR